MPGTSGRMCEKRTERTVWLLSSAITSWKREKRSYGTPPPFSKHSTMSSSTVESVGIHCAVDREVVGRGRARQPGGVLRGQASSAPSRDRARRCVRSSSRRATRGRSARRGPPRPRAPGSSRRPCSASASKRPVRWPTDTITASAPSFSISSMRPANASARLSSYVVEAMTTPPVTCRVSRDSSLPDRADLHTLRAGEPRPREVLQRVRRAARRAGAAGRGAAGRLGALRRPRRLHRTGRAARSGGRSGDPHAVLRARPRGAPASRRHGREVHRGCGDGRLRRADGLRRRLRARRPRRVRGPRLGRAGRARGANRGEHRRGDRRARSASRARRGDGRRRRREHGGTTPVRRSGRSGPRRRGDVRGDAQRRRVPTGAARPREGQERAGPRVARSPRDVAGGRAPHGSRADDRPRSRARRPHGDLGARDRGEPRAVRDRRSGLPESASRDSGSSSPSSSRTRGRASFEVARRRTARARRTARSRSWSSRPR